MDAGGLQLAITALWDNGGIGSVGMFREKDKTGRHAGRGVSNTLVLCVTLVTGCLNRLVLWVGLPVLLLSVRFR